jgi:deoxyribonuclease IV
MTGADEFGAHVSSSEAPARAGALGSACFQLFTKPPSRWDEPALDQSAVAAFRDSWQHHHIRFANAHDSYLINLASPKPTLWRRSLACFIGELKRSTQLGLSAIVTHPGNATDHDTQSGLARNADAVAQALEEVPGSVRVFLEITAGGGTSIGASFENLGAILERISPEVRDRVGVCFDTCHALVAGYDLVNDYDGVWSAFDGVLGLARLGMFHLNDSKHPLGSNKDLHEHIGEGALGDEPFRRIVNDHRFAGLPMILETPKGENAFASDSWNLGKLRAFRGPRETAESS